jgi:hypothetical protein
MRELTENELSLLLIYSSGLISKEELEEQFPFKATYLEIEHYLDTFIKNKNIHGFESVLGNIPSTLTKQEEEKLYSRYLLVQGHYQHENIVTAFQTYFNTSQSNIATLLEAIDSIPKYLQDDDFKYPYIRKIIYAIGAQPEPYNLEALEVLSKADDERIRELALHQIEKRKKSGRWEAAKNAQ